MLIIHMWLILCCTSPKSFYVIHRQTGRQKLCRTLCFLDWAYVDVTIINCVVISSWWWEISINTAWNNKNCYLWMTSGFFLRAEISSTFNSFSIACRDSWRLSQYSCTSMYSFNADISSTCSVHNMQTGWSLDNDA